jgi:hypothetical protein
MKTPIWEKWTGVMVKHDDTVLIATTEAQWPTRFSIWQKAYLNDVDTKCPMPMPEGNLVFKSNLNGYRLINNNDVPHIQRELF